MHQPCIKHDALTRTYALLGRDKPHASSSAASSKVEREEVKQPLSPKETGAAGSVQDSIGVNSSSAADNKKDSVVDAEAPTAGDKKGGDSEAVQAPGSGRKPGRPKKGTETNGDARAGERPYEGLFDVEIRLDVEAGPPQLVFTDLREDVKGGDREWTEPIMCLCCGTQCV